MSELRRLLEAAATLSHSLHASGVPHAFYGSVFTAVLANSLHSDVCCFPFPDLMSPYLFLGASLHCRERSSSPLPQSPGRTLWPPRFHDDSFALDQSVSSIYPSHILNLIANLFRLHATYRRLIPAIEVSVFFLAGASS
jgi:hypothetical protein